MPIDSLNSLNKADIVKLALGKRSAKTAQPVKPTYLTMEGSIFSANSNLVDANVSRSFSVRSSSQKQTGTNNSSGSSSSGSSSTNGTSASEGNAQAAEQESSTETVKTATSNSQKAGKTAERYGKDAEKQTSDINKGTKSFEKRIKAEQKTYTAAQAKMNAITNEIDENDSELKAMQSEYESLTAGDNTGTGSTSAFSLKIGAAVNQSNGSDSSSNAGKINDLANRIGAKSSLSAKYGAKIGTLQKTCTRSVKNMKKLSKNQQKTYTKQSKKLTNTQNETSKIQQRAEDLDELSQLTVQGGQALSLAGKGLVALGSSLTVGGAALIAAGKTMQMIGKAAVTFGNYGSAIANVTKTAAYAAEGNLKGAIASAGSAIQSGVAAAKESKTWSSDMKSIKASAQDATDKLNALKQAKEEVQNGGAVDGMTKKQTKKALQEQYLNGADTAKARSNIADNLKAEQTNVNTAMTSEITDSGKTIKNTDKFTKKVNKQAAKNVAANAKSSVSQYQKNLTDLNITTTESKLFKELDSYGKGLTTLASQLPDTTSTKGKTSSRRSMPLSPYAKQLIAQRRNRAMSISRMYAA